jgi:phosphoribosyl-AMP cyclohydrolase
MSKTEIEEGTAFKPRFDGQGLIPCITTSARDGAVLMFAWMNKEALQKTMETGEAHYWSRSRGELWHKGGESGFVQKIVEMRTDCDQDCLWLRVEVAGNVETACHTGRRSCFYRVVPAGQEMVLKFVDDSDVMAGD